MTTRHAKAAWTSTLSEGRGLNTKARIPGMSVEEVIESGFGKAWQQHSREPEIVRFPNGMFPLEVSAR